MNKWLKIFTFLIAFFSINACVNEANNIRSEIKKTRAQYNLIKPNSPNFIIEIGKFDQKVRKNTYKISQSQIDKKSKSELQQANIVLMNYIDSKNIQYLLEIKPKDKWFSQKEFGGEAAMYAFLIMQHAPAETQRKYYSELKTAMQSGDLPKKEFALFEDRIRVGNGQKQLYGSQFHCEAGKLIPFPIENIENINERRKSMELVQSFEEYGEQLGKRSKCD